MQFSNISEIPNMFTSMQTSIQNTMQSSVQQIAEKMPAQSSSIDTTENASPPSQEEQTEDLMNEIGLQIQRDGG